MKCFEVPISLRKHLLRLPNTFKIGVQSAIKPQKSQKGSENTYLIA